MTGHMKMSTLIVRDQASIDHTAGYGNMVDSHTFTENRILDNNVCDADLHAKLGMILSAEALTDIWPDAPNVPVDPDSMNTALRQVIDEWVRGCPNRYAGISKCYGVLSYLTGGDIEKRVPAVARWMWEMLPEDEQKKLKKGKRRKAA